MDGSWSIWPPGHSRHNDSQKKDPTPWAWQLLFKLGGWSEVIEEADIGGSSMPSQSSNSEMWNFIRDSFPMKIKIYRLIFIVYRRLEEDLRCSVLRPASLFRQWKNKFYEKN